MMAEPMRLHRFRRGSRSNRRRSSIGVVVVVVVVIVAAAVLAAVLALAVLWYSEPQRVGTWTEDD